MRKIILLLAVCCLALQGCRNREHYDVVVVGATPGGIMAAVSAARAGKSVLLLERSAHIGGLPANGLGATDIDTRDATTGLFREFTGGILAHYTEAYGPDSDQVRDCRGGYYFEPKVAEKVFTQMLAAHSPIEVLTRRQFDSSPDNVTLDGARIVSIRVTDRDTGKEEQYSAGVFIDATYEGDLAAAAGVPYRVGREAASEYGEIGAGGIYKFWDGPEIDSLCTREGDSAIQAYNFRLSLTRDPQLKIDFRRPDDYDRSEYVSLIDDLLQGRRQDVGPMKEGIAVIVNSVSIPNGKVDANNQHSALLSTDLPEENYRWPEADWAWRDRFADRLRSYTLGLLWFAANDPALPEAFREQVGQWGFARDEYEDNDHFPRQVYVREGRRITGLHTFTANDALPAPGSERPPVHPSSITAGHYSLDSHATRKREQGKPVLEGFLSYKTKPYTVPYGVIVPRVTENLLCPVPVSGTHIGFSTLRMEPCWMALGQAAGIAAGLMLESGLPARELPVERIQQALLDGGATLIYFEDVKAADPDFGMVQVMGLKGYLPGFRARLDETADAQTLAGWKALSGVETTAVAEATTRREALREFYHNLK